MSCPPDKKKLSRRKKGSVHNQIKYTHMDRKNSTTNIPNEEVKNSVMVSIALTQALVIGKCTNLQ